MPIWLIIVRIEPIQTPYFPLYHIMEIVKTNMNDMQRCNDIILSWRSRFPSQNVQAMYFSRDLMPPGKED